LADEPGNKSRQCPICNQKKGNCHFLAQLNLNPPCLECQHTWIPAGIQYKGTDLKVIHGRAPIRLLGIRYNMWLDSTAHRRYVMDEITEMACFLRENRDLSIENSLRLIECTLAPLLAFSGPVITWPDSGERIQTTFGSLCKMQKGSLAYVTQNVHGTFYFPQRPRRSPDKNAKSHHMPGRVGPPNPLLQIR